MNDDDAKPTCCIEGCGSPVLARGWCGAHYQRWRQHGNPLGSAPRRRRPECSVDGCARPHQAHGLCKTHGSRLLRTGVVDDYVPVIERFDLFVMRGAPDECWEWLGPRNNANYGRIGLLYAHRVACERAHGAPPSADSVAMHSCDNPPCVNPAHLQWGSQSENLRDMYAKGRHPKGRRLA